MATFAIYSIFAPKKKSKFIYLFIYAATLKKKKKKPNKFQDKSSLLLELSKFGFCLESSSSSKKGLT